MHHTKLHDETALPKPYETMTEHMLCRLNDVQVNSFWTSDMS